MNDKNLFSKPVIAFIGDYTPRRCGIATFTRDMFDSYSQSSPGSGSFVVAVEDLTDQYVYPKEVRWKFEQDNLQAYRDIAEKLNRSSADVICIQHEFGIYGGESGSFLLHLVKNLTKPFVITLHTVLNEPSEIQKKIIRGLSARAAQVVVMSEKGASMLRRVYDVPAAKIRVIPHGVPDVPFVSTELYKDRLGFSGKRIIMTFGLLSPNKGIEVAIKALPEAVKHIPDLLYVILGATHPNLLREEGEAYREKLLGLAQALGVEKHIAFHNGFVDNETLVEYLLASDVYLTPYLNEAQSTSGTLAYSVGCGKAVISTPYWHAQELLANGRGILVDFGCVQSLSRSLINLLTDDNYLVGLRERAYRYARSMTWKQVAGDYRRVYEWASNNAKRSLKKETGTIKLDHLVRMTDSTGLIQHARYGLPYRQEGYCIDDNARGLLFCVRLMRQSTEWSTVVPVLMETYAAFVGHAFDEQNKVFRNFMSYDRQWLEDRGSDDAQGRTVWALGETAAYCTQDDMVKWASHYLKEVIPSIDRDMTSPRAWAFTSIGLSCYLKKQSDEHFDQLKRFFNRKLVDIYERSRREDWEWFETGLSYDNARLAQALIMSDNEAEQAVGLKVLRWLLGVQTDSLDYFRPVGNHGFGLDYEESVTDFDQQPVEVWATIDACHEAFILTGDQFWVLKGRQAFSWFIGENQLLTEVYNESKGACYDGLHAEGPNLNCGAESCLSYLASRIQMEGWLQMAPTVSKESVMIRDFSMLTPMETRKFSRYNKLHILSGS